MTPWKDNWIRKFATKELELRVNELERENCRFNRLGLTALVVAGLIFTLGQAIPQQPDVNRSEFPPARNKKGRQVGQWPDEKAAPICATRTSAEN